MQAAGWVRFCGVFLLTTLAMGGVSQAGNRATAPFAAGNHAAADRSRLAAAGRGAETAAGETRTRRAHGGDDGGRCRRRGGRHQGRHLRIPTAGDATPWWQVDLGQSLPLGRIVIYNRCDGKVEDRAARIAVLLSDDGKAWQQVYQHDGTKFFGQTGGPPLTVDAGGKPARFVRLQLPAGQYFHLDEVEVYRADGNENVALHRPADQSSVSQWSKPHTPLVAVAAAQTPAAQEPAYPVEEVLTRGLALAADLRRLGTDVAPQEQMLREVEQQFRDLGQDAPAAQRRELYLQGPLGGAADGAGQSAAGF